MARLFALASSQYLERTAGIITAPPLTMACWVKFTTIPANGSSAMLLSLNNSGNNNNFFLDYYHSGSIYIRVVSQGSGVAYEGINESSLSTGVWYHALATIASTSSRHAYLNGVTAANLSSPGTVTVSGINNFDVGVQRYNTSSFYAFLDGAIAEVGLWNVALDDAEITALATGFSPRMIRPSALVGYWPLIGRNSPETPAYGVDELTLVNTPTVADHPRIIMPRAEHVLRLPGVAAAPSYPIGARTYNLKPFTRFGPGAG